MMKHTDFKSLCIGSAHPQLIDNSISTLKFLVPSKELMCFFDKIHSVFENIENLLKQKKVFYRSPQPSIAKTYELRIGGVKDEITFY